MTRSLLLFLYDAKLAGPPSPSQPVVASASQKSLLILTSHRYFPHVLFSLALTTISINLVSHRRTAEDERSRVQARISVLESIKEQLQSGKPLSNEELDRQKKLARPPVRIKISTFRKRHLRIQSSFIEPSHRRIPWPQPCIKGHGILRWDSIISTTLSNLTG
jgi:hypothetical protein